MATSTKHPSVLWAQREGFLYLTIEVDDAKIEDLTLSEASLHFKGTNTSGSYEATLDFFDDIDRESLKKYSGTRFIELTVNKKTAKWWPRLLKSKEKVHWLKVDFGKWKDEDESDLEDEPAAGASGFDLSNYMSQLGGAPGGPTDFDGLDDMGDEDEDDMPDLEDAKDEEGEDNKEKAK